MNTRISATTLEAYRLYLSGVEWLDYDALAAQLRGERTATPPMTRGTSLHEILETPPEQRWAKFGSEHEITVISGCFGNSAADMDCDVDEETVPCYTHLGHTWLAEEVDDIPTTEGVNEIKVEYPIQTAYGESVLVAKADKVNGLEITDYKTTTSFDAEKYLASVQWKIYCLAFGATRFTYRVFEIKEKAGEPHHIRDSHELPCTPYPGMAEEVRELAEDFISFCLAHGFERAIGIKPQEK